MFNGSDCAAQTENQLTRSLRTLDEQITQLEKQMEILAQRLKPVRNERPLTESKELQSPRIQKSPLTDGIEIFGSRVMAIRKHMDCLLQEIEL